MNNNIDRIGVSEVQRIVCKELQWIFREQPTDDYGIDAIIEVTGTKYPTGKLIAVQIKSGKSYFSTALENGVTFRFDQRHHKYWMEHTCPVILVLYNPDKDECIWEKIDKNTAKKVSDGKYIIMIPVGNRFDASAKIKLVIVAYRNNIANLAQNIDDLDVDSQSLFVRLDDDQKKIFLKARCEYNKKNASAARASLDYNIQELNILANSIKESNQKGYVGLDRLYLGGEFGKAYSCVESFIQSSGANIMIILGLAGIGKTTLVNMIAEKHKVKNDVLLLKGSYFPEDLASTMKSLHRLNKNIKTIIIDGWNEQASQENRYRTWQQIVKWQDHHAGIKIIITSRKYNEYFGEGAEVFEMQPFSQSDSINYLKTLTAEDYLSGENIKRIISICNTPLLLKMIATASKERGLSLEEFTTENYLFSFLTAYSDNEIVVLEQLAFNMWENELVFIKIDNVDELFALNKYKELLIDNGNVSFMHKFLLDLFTAKYIFRYVFQKQKTPEAFETAVYDVFSKKLCSIEILDYIKILIKHYIVNEDVFVKQISFNLCHMLDHESVVKKPVNTDSFKAVSNVFYAVWHLTSYVNRMYMGTFQLQISQAGGINLACLIDIFNKNYFSREYLDFSNVDIIGLQLWRCNLTNMNFKNSKLCHANFLGSCLDGSSFEQSNLSYCNLNSTDLRHANLRNVILTSANVSHCMISEDSLQYFLPYKDTIKNIDKLIIFMNDKTIARFSELF